MLTVRSIRGAASATITAMVREGQSLDVPVRLSSGWAALELTGLQDTPLYGGTELDALSRGAEVTRGQEGGSLEGYGPYGIRGNQSINSAGQRGQNNNFLLDGLDNNDAWLHDAALQPPLERIDFVSLASGYIPAEFGRATGAVINVRTRSGTNQLHGSAFDYFQNSALNARNFFDGADKPASVRNQFGGSVGGPVRENDWFYFLDAEGLRERRGLTVISTVPSAAQKTGDFGSALIYDPRSIFPLGDNRFARLLFPQNRIPASMILAPARNLISLYPDPNLPGVADNYRFTPSSIDNGERIGARSDKILTSRSALFARFAFEHRNQQSPGALPAFAGSDFRQHADAADTSLTQWNGAVSHDFAFNAALVNRLRTGITRIQMDGQPADAALNAGARLGIPGLSAGGLPVVAPEGFAQLGANNTVPFQIRTTSYQIEDSVRWTRGRHTMEAGFAAIRRLAGGNTSDWTSRANFLFTPDYTSQPGVALTGNSIASLLTGFPTEVRRDTQLAAFHLRAWEWSGFIQDEVRLSRRLTIQAGIRYSLDPPLTEANNRLVNFDFQAQATKLTQFAGQGGINPYAGVAFYKRAIAPRIGFALDVFGTGSTMLRGGFSKAYDPGSYLTTGALARNPPYASRLDLINGTFQLGPSLSDGVPTPVFTTLLDPAGINAANTAINAIGPGNYQPYSDQWGLTLEQRLPDRLTLEVAGLSSMGAHLYERYNSNQPFPAPTPYPFARYPLEPYHVRVDYLDLAGGSTYYGGQLKLRGEPRPGLHLEATYRYAKSIDDSTAPGTDQDSRPSGPQHIYGLRSVRSVSPFDVPQRLMVTAAYDVPFHSGRRWLNAALANWRAGLWLTMQSGLPFTPQLAVNSLNNGGFQLPDRIATGSLPSSQQSYLHWFNTSLNPADPNRAFQIPTVYQFGNSGFDILRGPVLRTTDVSLSRDFLLREPLRLRTRLEVFNLLNQVNLALPDRILGTDSAGLISHTATASRQIELLVKLEW